jgi:hydroxymethylpyrimidine pyrophosphatase-like HAD family hydrolase
MSFNLHKLFNKLKDVTEKEGDMAHPRTIAVDVDGTLAKYDGWKGSDVIGEPIQSVVDEVRKEKENGTKIIIHTTRTNASINKTHTTEQLVGFVKAWLDKNGIPYDEIWSGTGKPIAHEYWDDRAVKKP